MLQKKVLSHILFCQNNIQFAIDNKFVYKILQSSNIQLISLFPDYMNKTFLYENTVVYLIDFANLIDNKNTDQNTNQKEIIILFPKCIALYVDKITSNNSNKTLNVNATDLSFIKHQYTSKNAQSYYLIDVDKLFKSLDIKIKRYV